MSSINDLLNHEPAPAQRRSSRPSTSPEQQQPPPPHPHAHPQPHPHAHPTRALAPLRFDAAAALTTLAAGQQCPPGQGPLREQPQAHSPGLEQYHHGDAAGSGSGSSSRSPDERRRQSQSLLPRASPAPALAPMPALPALPALPAAVAPTASAHDPARETHMRHATPRDATPAAGPAQPPERRHSVATDSVDAETLKAIEALKQNDLGLRHKRTASVAESVSSPSETKPSAAASKKRPAPATSVKKKGTAALKKASSKKRRIDTDSDSKARSATPTSRNARHTSIRLGTKGSQAGTPAAESSPAPDHSSQTHVSDEEADSSEDDTTLYCICRKPDNHRWMIGCDGGCDDWFHGSCVNMVQSDEDLVDKFICPNCETAGRGQTTWKPVCRRQGCRKPARLVKGKESKYCSDECGVLFFQEQLQRTAGANKKPQKRSKKKPAKESGKESELQDRASDHDEEPTPLGGVIRAQDLKALAVASKDIQTFKRLGSGVLSPPHTASPTKANFAGVTNGTSMPKDDLPFTPSEREHLGALLEEKTHLELKLEILKDRERFVSMAREQAIRYAENEKTKPKEFCGYDSRLSWSDTEFKTWREGRFGRAAFEFDTLSPTTEQIDSLDGHGDVQMTDMNGAAEETICTKKRCTKHPQWQKLNLQDARFEEVEVVEAIKECEKSERAVRERARRRGQKDDMEAELMGGEKHDERNRDGWAQQVVAA